VGKFNKKKIKVKRIFARMVFRGKWHVAGDNGSRVFFPCQPWPSFGSPARKPFGIFRGPFDGFIFTKPHKICGTCMKMERNRETLKEAGFIT